MTETNTPGSIVSLVSETLVRAGSTFREDKKEAYRQANVQVRSAYETLKKRGEPEIYYLSHDELGLPMDGMIEGVHPNDFGMRFLAAAFEKKIMEIWRVSKTARWDN